MAQGLLGFLLYLIAAPLFLRLHVRIGPAATMLAGAFASWGLTLGGLLASGHRVNFWAFSTTYWFFALCLLMAFGAIHKSISLRIVAYLRSTSRTHAEIKRDVLHPSFEERLALIEEKRYAERVGERLILTRSGRRIARGARRLQGIFGVTRSG